jgi:hypothetical protein
MVLNATFNDISGLKRCSGGNTKIEEKKDRTRTPTKTGV